MTILNKDLDTHMDEAEIFKRTSNVDHKTVEFNEVLPGKH